MKRQDITGQKFGKLTVIKRLGLNSSGHSIYLCQCECGNFTKVSRPNLKSGSVKSCGCLLKHSEKRHGLSKTPLYNSWRDMKIRCYNENSPSYVNYGGRGIKVCEEWLNDFMTFYKWAMANGYKKGLSIDRIDVNGNYEPNNCRWVSMKVQQNNRRNNHYITYRGETHTLMEWSEITGINYDCLKTRINTLKWSIEKALTTPSGRR